jgi:preprotein translocase subunit SecF
MEIFRVKTDIPFMKFRKISAIISTSIFIASILFLVTRGLNLGVDFTGGTLMEVSYPQAANLEEIRSTLKKIDLPEAQVQNFGTSSDVSNQTSSSRKFITCRPIRKNCFDIKGI